MAGIEQYSKEEAQRGLEIAEELAKHLVRSGATKSRFNVVLDDIRYEIDIERPNEEVQEWYRQRRNGETARDEQHPLTEQPT